MSMMDGLIEEELRTIVAHREDVASAWSDDEVIAEARRRARGRAGSMATNGPDAHAMDHWLAVIAVCRRGAAGKEAVRSPDGEGLRAQMIP